MKRTVSLFLSLLLTLSVLTLSLCACGNDEIKLTLDNYETYLDINCSGKLGGARDYGEIMVGKHIGSSVYTTIGATLTVNGKSDNYNYHDVSVTAKITGNYVPYSVEVIRQINGKAITMENYISSHLEPVDITLNANTDIVGHGSDSHTIQLPSNLWLLDKDADFLTYEIVDVSGTLTPA